MKRLIIILTICFLGTGILAVILFGLISFVREYETPKVYEAEVNKYCCKFEVDINYVYAVIKAESNFNEKAVSDKGAEGLMQIMPSTAKYIAIKLGESAENIDLFNPELNLRYGIWYISYLSEIFNYDKMLVAAAYNAGEGNVRVWQAKYAADGFFDVTEIPFAETQVYVQKVLRYYEMYRNKYNY